MKQRTRDPINSLFRPLTSDEADQLMGMPTNTIDIPCQVAACCRQCGREYFDLSAKELLHMNSGHGCPSDDCPAHTKLITTSHTTPMEQREQIIAKIGPTGYGSWGIRWFGSRAMDARGGYSGPYKDETEAREGVQNWREFLDDFGTVTVEVVENVNRL